MKSAFRHFVIGILAVIFLPIIICAEDYMYFDSDFDPIILENIASKNDSSEGQATIKLYMSGDVEITADQSQAAQLKDTDGGQTDTMVTEYRIDYLYNGSNQTGEYAEYNNFLSTPVSIAYVPDNNEVQVTLHIRASNRPDNVSDSGIYTATQTLTVSWGGL